MKLKSLILCALALAVGTSLVFAATQASKKDQNQTANNEISTNTFESVSDSRAESSNQPGVESLTKPVVQEYFEAVVNEEILSFNRVFSEDAVITVVSRELDTLEKRMRFATNEVFGGAYEVYRAEQTHNGIRMLLRFTPEGWNRPEPLAVYDFKIENNLITQANLQYATDEDLDYFENKTLEDTSLIPYGFSKYLEGVEKDQSEILILGFTEDGRVLDVSRTIEGRQAIKRWADKEVLSLEYSVGKIVFTKKGARLYNNIRFGQNTSGFYASYDLDLKEGLIHFSDLQYAKSSDFNFR